jgi:ribosomal protein S21
MHRLLLVGLLLFLLATSGHALVLSSPLVVVTKQQRCMARSMVSIQLTYANKAEPLDSVLRRFRRAVNKSGHLWTGRHQRFWESSADLKKRKKERARFKSKIFRQQGMMKKQMAGISRYDDNYRARDPKREFLDTFLDSSAKLKSTIERHYE